jgi:hypothetical protein
MVIAGPDLNAVAKGRIGAWQQARLSRESAFKEVSKSLRELLIRLEGEVNALALAVFLLRGLTAYVDEDVAARAAYLSAALSRACHYHPYELSPTASELTRWLNETADLVALLRSRTGLNATNSPS